MIKPISISLSPNTEPDDVRLAFGLLFQPWRWFKGKEIKVLEKEFQKYLGIKHAFAFNSGRSALMAILQALLSSEALAKEDEVLLQAFTCNAVPNPVIWAGLKPVYVDCREDDYNIDVDDLERKITLRQAQGGRPRAVIVQHTFGLPADMEKVQEVCKKHNLVLIEDCAHALGATYKGKKVGTFGKAAFFSFSRDKVISSVYGGMVATNDSVLAQNIQTFQQEIEYPSLFWTLQQLLHPILMNWLILPTYRIFGKYLLILFQWLHILSKAVHWKEKRGIKPSYFPKRLSNALAILALHQFQKLERFNAHRKELAKFYGEQSKNSGYILPQAFPEREHIFLRFPLRHAKAHEIIRKGWERNFLIGDWYTSPVAPEDTRLDALGYIQGSCPTAEKLSQETLNLPTHIRMKEKDAAKIIEFLKTYGT
ncbi:MAG: Pleiotropic regulatory protein [Parcubacteria group bacterium Greene0714_21]|nr:MAG: Pleiotropic regulatory protein [Parcubacteria group bacterium Greene0416_39]TSC97646.1 MAG: Pleiotropic regulatory protein [Parcubacteria group bacterium Greene1014_47]TSD03876.1 MAG: Pleiotropic regulatory protein [Parcubacteria group bacterium Greene0714_21]